MTDHKYPDTAVAAAGITWRKRLKPLTVAMGIGVALAGLSGRCSGSSYHHPDAGAVVVSGPHDTGPVANEAYLWKPVAIGAGGFITGMAFDPSGQTRLIRTDVYGAYIWDSGTSLWRQLINAASMPAGDQNKSSAQGVYEIAVAPSNSSQLYMAFKGWVYSSSDRGAHWTRASSGPFPIAFDPNSNFRFHGPFMAVSPRNPNIVLLGTPANGVLRSTDGGHSWSQISSLPASQMAGPAPSAGNDPAPGALIWFVPNSQELWVMAQGSGMYHSTDNGATFTALSAGSGQPVSLTRGAFAPDGSFWGVDTTAQDVWAYHNGAWRDLVANGSLNAKSYQAVAIDKNDGTIFLFDNGGRVWKSSDGVSFFPIPRTIAAGAGDPPWLSVDNQTYFAIADVVFDPVVPGRLWTASGVGAFEADRPVGTLYLNWLSQSRGIEELVANDVIHTTGEAPLFAAWDFGIHRKPDLNAFSTGFGPVARVVIAAQQLAWTPADPQFVATNASDTRNCCSADGMSVMAGYSTDNGQTWARFATLPTPPGTDPNDPWRMSYGMIAVAADNTNNIIWAPSFNRSPFYTKDRGKTWTRVTLPGEILPYTGSHATFSYDRKTLVADRVLPGTFYYYHSGDAPNHALQGLWITHDGGVTWTRMFTGEIAPLSMYSAKLRVVPGHAGAMFFTSGVSGGDTTLRRSNDEGATWSLVTGVNQVDDIAFGKAAPGASWPTIFISGRVGGTYGIWRSVDNAASWHMVTPAPAGTLDQVTSIEGDKDVFGRVYVGYKGSGWRYGEPASCQPAAYKAGDNQSCDAVQ